MSASNDWLQFYHQQQQQQHFSGVPPSSSSNTTTVTTVSTASPPMLNSSSSASPATHLSPEGRVAKPIRRRSRASRRTPTTLLNTDTTNFRAMVQQFTGGPSAPYAPTASSASASSGSGLAHLGFGFGPRQAHGNPTGLMVAHPGGYHHLQPQHQLYQQQYGFNGNTDGGENRFFQRLNNNPRPPNVTDDGIGGFVMDHGGIGRFFPSTSWWFWISDGWSCSENPVKYPSNGNGGSIFLWSWWKWHKADN